MSIARNTLVQSSLTLTSRLLGLARDVFLAAKIGAGPVGDAFYTALMFPNLFRRVFAEGAFAQAFVPAYARTLEAEGEEAAKAVAQETLRALFAITAALAVIAQIAMPWIMIVIHGGYRDDPVHFPLAISLTQITMPYLAFMSICALFSGVLNSAGRFALSAAAPTLLNVCLLVAAISGTTPRETAFYAATAITVSGVLQAILLWWGTKRQKVSLSLGFPKFTPSVKKVMALAIPGTIAASGMQLNILISQSLASFETGAKTWLQFADRLYQLPLGLVGVAVGIAILPRLARAARISDQASSNDTMNQGIGLAMALTLPAAVALMVIPFHLVNDIFARGAFGPEDAEQTARALFHFGWGVPAFVLIKVLTPPFFAREDTVTPMRFSLISVVTNIIIGASLFFWLKSRGGSGFVGLAVATSISAWINVSLLALTLMHRGIYRADPDLISRLVRVMMAATAMGFTLFFAAEQHAQFQNWAFGMKEGAVILIAASGALVYTIAAFAFGAVRPSDLRQAVKRPN